MVILARLFVYGRFASAVFVCSCVCLRFGAGQRLFFLAITFVRCSWKWVNGSSDTEAEDQPFEIMDNYFVLN